MGWGTCPDRKKKAIPSQQFLGRQLQGKARLAGRVGGDLAKSALLPVESVQVLLAVALLARRTGLHYFAWKWIITISLEFLF